VIVAIVSHTPLWVFGLLVLLAAMGIVAMRTRLVRLPRVLITPAVFIVWGIEGLVTKPQFSSLLAGEWVLALAAGAVLAVATTRPPALRVDRARSLIHLPGSVRPLIRIMVVFFAKYGLAVAAGFSPETRDSLVPWDVAVSGLGAGYFLGWLLRFLQAYRKAPALALPSPALEGGIP
jgi:hypothetical protein